MSNNSLTVRRNKNIKNIEHLCIEKSQNKLIKFSSTKNA